VAVGAKPTYECGVEAKVRHGDRAPSPRDRGPPTA
jgi:hypothetical protein